LSSARAAGTFVLASPDMARSVIGAKGDDRFVTFLAQKIQQSSADAANRAAILPVLPVRPLPGVFQVGDDVVPVLQPQRKADASGLQPAADFLFVRDRRVRHGERILDQRLDLPRLTARVTV